MRPQTFVHPSFRRAPRLVPAACAALAIVLASTPASWAARQVDRTVAASAGALIEVENTAGSVRVRGWDNDQVQITGTIGDDVSELVVEGGPDRILIEVDTPDRRGWGRREIDARLDIKVPRGARLEIETVSASIDVEAFDGRLEAETVSGSIEVSGSLTQADVQTVSGSIRLDGANTDVVAESVSGSIRLRGVSGRVEASTVSGSVDVQAGTIERGDVESVSGSVGLSCKLARDARLDIGSHSGNVTVELPADVSASFEASTFSGRIENDFGPQAERTSKWVPSRSLEFTTGRGDAEVTLETFSGSLRIVKR